MFAGVRLTHPDRVLFPDAKITKRDLAVYYTAVAPFILPHVEGRPLSLVRCPNGRTQACFYQKHLGESDARSGARDRRSRRKRGTATYIAIDDLAGLISLVQMGVLEIHPWGCREDRIDQPDRLIFDIDPAEDLAWADVVRSGPAGQGASRGPRARKLRADDRRQGPACRRAARPSRILGQSSKPSPRLSRTRSFASSPNRYVAQASKAKRPGKIYVDYLRNEKGATAIACFSTRARPGATVATPVSWDELSSLKPGQFNIHTVVERLGKLKKDPWNGFFQVRQALTRDMQRQLDGR